jgi:hypothetical protein
MALSWTALEETVKNWINHPVPRPFINRVEAAPGVDVVASGKRFVPEASYFGVKLIEMSLAEGGKYFIEFLPLGVCLAEYTIGDQRQRNPTILSNDLIASQIKNAGAKPGYVDLTNMPIVRRAPVKADNLSLFVGLFRMPYNDLAKQVLQIAADLTEQTNLGASIGSGLRVAEKVYDRVAGLFQLNVMSPRFGFANGTALTESGYLLVAGPAANTLTAERLSVVNGKLQVDGRRAEGFDYCLIAFEHTTTLLPEGDNTINSLTTLGFHRRYREISQLLALKNVAKAEEQMPQLRAEVLGSPELTEDDRLVTIAAYDTSYEKLREALIPKMADGPVTRAARSDTPASGLLSEAEIREAAGQVATGNVLKQMAVRLQVPGPTNDPDDVFATEAAALRTALPAQDGTGRPHLVANVAEAIGGALARREG